MYAEGDLTNPSTTKSDSHISPSSSKGTPQACTMVAARMNSRSLPYEVSGRGGEQTRVANGKEGAKASKWQGNLP